MTLSTKSITSMFWEVVRSHPLLKSWKKKGVRAVWSHERAIPCGIAVVLFKASYEEAQQLGIVVSLGYPAALKPIQEGWGGTTQDGMFVVETFVSKTLGMQEALDGNDQVWTLSTPEDLEQFRRAFFKLVDEAVIPWLERTTTFEGFDEWYSERYPFPAGAPYMLHSKGREAVLRALAQFLETCPECRPSNAVLEWLVEHELIAKDVSQQLRHASMQHRDTYCKRLREIAKRIHELIPTSA